MRSMNRRAMAAILLAAFLAPLMFTAAARAAAGTLDICCPWGAADQTAEGARQVEVSYGISTKGPVSQSAVDAVQAAINDWNAAIDTRERGRGWDFDLVPFGRVGGAAGNARGNGFAFDHNPNAPPGNGGGGGDDGGSGGGPDISITIKKGGGVIAGSAQRTVDAGGFVVQVKISISGSAFGLENDSATIKEVAMHELGHALGLGHHSNEADLMGHTVGYEGGGPSACDLDGFVAVHHWLTTDTDGAPHLNHVSSVTC